MSEDLDRLRAVLDLIKERGLSLSAVSVGEIRVVLQPAQAAPVKAAVTVKPDKPPTPDEQKMADLRKRARALFGKDIPDDQLLAMEGAL
jgi:hypothetical protein